MHFLAEMTRVRSEVRRTLRGEFFSLGGVLAPYATTRLTLAPWALSAAVLAALAMWDPIAREGSADPILIGLAWYELLIGLTQPSRNPGQTSGRGSDPSALLTVRSSGPYR